MVERILIVEEDENLVSSLADKLRAEGYDVHMAQDGERGWELAQHARYDLIVLDIMLPGLDGLSLCRMIRNDSKTADVPIIMLTARGTEVDKIVGLESGADDYIVKPFGLGEFLARVRVLFRSLRISKRVIRLNRNNSVTAVRGIRVGHYTDKAAATGCTVILCPPGTVGAVDVRGGAPGTRETDALAAHNLVEEVTAVVLSGGSAFGLAAADGVMRWHVERGLGYQSRAGAVVPIVPAAILYDLGLGKSDVAPDGAAGYAACENATDDPVESGCLGAGTGAKVGAIMGMERASKGGLGSAAIDLPGGLVVAALMAVNALGNVLDERGQILAGLRSAGRRGFDSILETWASLAATKSAPSANENTVIGLVATNARLSKVQAQKVAQMAHDGIARAVCPAHTMYDGDTIFVVATGEVPAEPSLIGGYAAEAVTAAIRDAVRSATSLAGIRAIADD